MRAHNTSPADRKRDDAERTNSQRSPRRQYLTRHLHAAGPRPVFEALLEVAAGRTLDYVLERYGRIPVRVYHELGADELPIDSVIDGGPR